MKVEVTFERGQISIKSTGDPIVTVAILEMGKAMALKELLNAKQTALAGLVRDA